jgi:hypothetical protein
MDRISEIKSLVDGIISGIQDPTERWCAYSHLFGVSQSCAMIAAKRGENIELATIAGLLHDIYEYKNYNCLESLVHRPDHGIRNSELARAILTQLHLLDNTELQSVCDAIKVHGYKDFVHTPFDEVIKDGDVFQKQINNIHTPIHPINKDRFMNSG